MCRIAPNRLAVLLSDDLEALVVHFNHTDIGQ